MYLVKLCVPFLICLLIQCKPEKSNDSNKKTVEAVISPERIEITYSVFTIKKGRKDSLEKQYTPQQLAKLMALNRVDMGHLLTIDSIIIPNDFKASLIQYSPFPVSLPFLNGVKKIILFSYASQSFAVYNFGVLVHWGPTNMGSKIHPTPAGIYFANWKAEETKSTFNDEWDLKWNVNLDNKEGIGWHQYTMPGFPASHSCLRLLEADAKYLYDWMDEWILLDKENILTKGTPAVIFGAYPFGKRKPWLNLIQNSHTLDISEKSLTNEVNPFLLEIKKWEQKRDSINLATNN